MLDMLPTQEAVTLLRQIIGTERADTEPYALPELARLCAGLPLALSIVGERIVSSRMPLTTLVDELSDRQKQLEAFSMGLDSESNAILSAFSWSYQALNPDAARLFRLLGVHPGPEFSVAAAAALVGLTTDATQKMLETLFRASLIDQPTNGRYRFHDLLRSYAIGRASQDESRDGVQAARRRVLHWYLHSSDAAEAVIDPGYRRIPLESADRAVIPATFADYQQAMDWYISERFNLIAATNDAATHSFPDLAWKIAAATSRFYFHRQYFNDWLETHQIGLKAAQQIGNLYGEAEILNSLGIAHVRLREIPKSLDCHQRALSIRREIGDRHGEGVSLNNLGFPYQYMGQLDEAYNCFNSALNIARESKNKNRQTISIINLSMVCLRLERWPEALDRARESLAFARELGAKDLECSAYDLIGESLHNLGYPIEAIEYHTRALETARKFLRQSYVQGSLHQLGRIYRTLGNPEKAVTYHRQALSMVRESGNRSQEGEFLDDLAEALKDCNETEEATSCWRESLVIFGELNPPAAAKIQAKLDEMASSSKPNNLHREESE
ncbi:SARP family transcriptional regulator [Kutzneria sp. CA-103260]|nr:SARP family transcriptional regulator [Kutzneria sp. CA-103260]